MTDARKQQLAEMGCEVLAELHPRDLIRVVDGFTHPAGRLAEDADTLPEGAETLCNYRRNKWWARVEDRVILICEDGV